MTTAFYPQPGMDAPAVRAFAVTPSNTVNLNGVRGLYVGTSGDVAVIMANDTAPVTLPGVQGGSILPISVGRVMATGTTAGGIVALV